MPKENKIQNDQSFNVHQKELIMRQPPFSPSNSSRRLTMKCKGKKEKKVKNKIKGQSPKKTNK